MSSGYIQKTTAPRQRAVPRLPWKSSKPERTKQHFKDECTLNQVVRRWFETGELPRQQRQLSYGDISQIGDLQDSINRVRRAEEAFSSLPAHIRAKLGNSPQRLIDAVTRADPKELAELGLSSLLANPENASDQAKPSEGGEAKAATRAAAKPTSGGDGGGAAPPAAS